MPRSPSALLTLSLALTAAIPTLLLAEVPRVATDIAPVHALVSRVMEGAGRAPSLLLPPGLAVLVVPDAGRGGLQSAPPVVVDVLTTARAGNVCNLWGSALRPRVLEARRRFPHMHAHAVQKKSQARP